MTDDLMDARLRAAGERWRAANTASATTTLTLDKDADIAPVSEPPRRARRWGLIASAAAVVAALVAGGSWLLAGSSGDGSHRAADGAAITRTVWQLSGTRSPGSGRFVRAGFVQFSIDADGRFAGHDECFTATGTAEISDSTITVPHPRVRAKECTDQYGTTLRDLLKVLRNPTGYTVSAGQLVFDGGGAGAFRFAPLRVVTPDSTALVTTRWRLTSVVQRNGTSVPAPRPLALRVDAHGRLVADDGANAVDADTTIGSDTITLSNVAVGAVGGTQADPVESAIDAMLTGTVRYSISGNTLTLTKPDGGALTYRAVSSPGTPLVGTPWRLVRIGESGKIDGGPRLRIDPAGRLVAHDLCGVLHGTVDVGRDSLAIRRSAGTPCVDPGFTPGTSTIDAVLSGAVRYSISGNELTIVKAGVGELDYSRSADPNAGTPSATATR